jgi:hypothetical protein
LALRLSGGLASQRFLAADLRRCPDPPTSPPTCRDQRSGVSYSQFLGGGGAVVRVTRTTALTADASLAGGAVIPGRWLMQAGVQHRIARAR